jgi:hypothetical protein
MGGHAANQIPPTTQVELMQWIEEKLKELEPLVDHPIGESGEAYMPVAVDRTKEKPRTVVSRLFDPSPGYVCFSEFRALVDELCHVDLAVELWQTFPAERIKKVHDLLRVMRWFRERLRAIISNSPPTDSQAAQGVAPLTAHAAGDGPAMGVSLFDAAQHFESGDDAAATGLVNHWHDGENITAKPIGKCPTDGRRQLYRLPELLKDITRINRLDKKEQNKLRNHLKARLRTPRN